MVTPADTAWATSSTSSSGKDEGLTDYVRAVLLDATKTHVLMLNRNGTWDLPYLVYEGTLKADSHRFCKDLQNTLGIKSHDETDFNIVFELLGPVASAEEDNGGNPGYAQLMLVEYRRSQCHLDSQLPKHAAWKDLTFVTKLLECDVEGEDIQISLEEIKLLLRPSKERLLSLREPRHQFGWFQAASSLLRTAAEKSGYGTVIKVVQMRMSSTSTILRADCENGACFLKSPVLGSKEAQITRKLSKCFPDRVPEVLKISRDLNAFVTKEFCNNKLSDHDVLGISLEAARLQISSIDFLEELKEAGCEVRGPLQLARVVETWDSDPLVTRAFRGKIDELQKCIPVILNMCDELTRHEVPLTIVHGDLYPHNATLRSTGRKVDDREFILFDWEYAYIGHPFCDLSTVSEKLQPEDLNIYLSTWSQYEIVEELQKAFELCCLLGWCIRMWRMFDYIRESDSQRHTDLSLHARDCFDEVYYATIGKGE